MEAKRLQMIMTAYGDNKNELANYLGISEYTLRRKLRNMDGNDFRQNEIKRIADRYNLDAEMIFAIFFSH